MHLTVEQVWAWINILLLAGCGLSAAGGVIGLARARRLPIFMLRQQAWRRGWKLLLLSALLLLALGLMLSFGRQGLRFLLSAAT